MADIIARGAKPKTPFSPGNIILYGTLIFVSIYYLLPLYVMVMTSLKDMTEIGLWSFTNWFTGFPGETLSDAAETLTLLWRTRNTTIAGRNFGICNLNPDTPLSQERERFSVTRGHFGGNWVTEDQLKEILNNGLLDNLVSSEQINTLE